MEMEKFSSDMKQSNDNNRRNFLSKLFLWLLGFLTFFSFKDGLFGIQKVSAATEPTPSGTIISDNGKTYKFVAFVIRNNGANNWEFINDITHAPVNGGVINTSATDITVNFNFTCKHIGTFVACPDETFAEQGYNFGASVGVNAAIIRCVRNAKVIGGYVYFDGYNWAVAGATGNLSVGGFNNGVLSLNHDGGFFGSYNISLVSRDGGVNVTLGGSGANSIEVQFRDFTGNLIKTPTTSMKVYITRSLPTSSVDPRELNIPGSNIWCYGVFEI